MPSITSSFDNSDNDRRLYGFRSGTVGTLTDPFFPTNVSVYERESQTPFTTGFPIGGLDTSAGLTEHKGFLKFPNVIIPKGSHIEKAEVKLFAKVNFDDGKDMQIQISAHTDATGETAQQTITYSSAFTYPVRDPKGTFTLTTGETTYVEKTADVTDLVQELVDQFEYRRNSDMFFRMTNKSFTVNQKAYPYPRPTTVPPSFPTVAFELQAQIYAIEQGTERSAKLIVTYTSPRDSGEQFADGFDYNLNSFQEQGFEDPARMVSQASADANFVTTDTSRIRVNAPFWLPSFVESNNRLDISCPSGIPHNEGCQSGDVGTGGILSQGVNDLMWNFRFKIDINSFVINTDPTPQEVLIGLSDSPNTSVMSTAQDFIGLKIITVSGSSAFHLIASAGSPPDGGGAIEGTFTTLPSAGVWYVEVAREGNSGLSNLSCTLYADQDYERIIERIQGVTIPALGGLDRLKYMCKNIDGTGNGDITVEFGQEAFGDPLNQPPDFPLSGKSTFFSGRVPLNELGHAVAREPSTEFTDFEDDMSLPANFIDNFSGDNWNPDIGTGVAVNTITEVIDWTANDSASNNATGTDMQDTLVSPTEWTMRFKLDITSLATGTSAVENRIFIGMSNLTQSSSASTSQSFIGLGVGTDNTTSRFFLTHGQGSIFINPTNFTTVPTIGTFYVEITRTSSTGATINIYSDAIFKTLVESVSDTISSNIPRMRFSKVQSRNDGVGADSTLSGTVDAWTVFSSLAKASIPFNWSEVGLGVDFNSQSTFGQSSGVIDWITDIDGTSKTSIHDLGSPASDTEWTLRFIFDTNTLTAGSSVGKYMWIGLFDSDQTVDSESAQDAIAFYFFVNIASPSGALQLAQRDTSALSNTGTNTAFTTIPSITDIQYIELKRTSATSAECTIYSDQDYTNVVETVTLTIPATVTGLRYLGIKNRNIASTTGGMTGTIDDVQFWNGRDRFEHKNRWDEVNT